MNDFLTRMARLTRGETTAVKPRLPGHFAPVTDDQPAGPLDDAPLAAGAYKRDPEPEQPQGQPAPGPVRRGPGHRAGGQETISVHPRQSVDTKTATHAPDVIRIELGDEVTPGQAPAGIPISPETQIAPFNRKPPTGMEWTVPDFDHADETDSQAGPLPPGNETDPVLRPENDMSAPTPSSPSRPKLLVRTQPAGRETTVLPDLPDGLTAAQHAQNEPVVHVNIGRIEVRASTPAPRPQPGPAPARQQSSLSLQDYLARGQSGGRRS